MLSILWFLPPQPLTWVATCESIPAMSGTCVSATKPWQWTYAEFLKGKGLTAASPVVVVRVKLYLVNLGSWVLIKLVKRIVDICDSSNLLAGMTVLSETWTLLRLVKILASLPLLWLVVYYYVGLEVSHYCSEPVGPSSRAGGESTACLNYGWLDWLWIGTYWVFKLLFFLYSTLPAE